MSKNRPLVFLPEFWEAESLALKAANLHGLNQLQSLCEATLLHTVLPPVVDGRRQRGGCLLEVRGGRGQDDGVLSQSVCSEATISS